MLAKDMYNCTWIVSILSIILTIMSSDVSNSVVQRIIKLFHEGTKLKKNSNQRHQKEFEEKCVRSDQCFNRAIPSRMVLSAYPHAT